MFHNLVNETMAIGAQEDRYFRLLDAIEGRGHRVVWHNKDLLTALDLNDAWTEFSTGGVDAAMAYLETMFGFEFDRKR